jgi:hypothetical protein
MRVGVFQLRRESSFKLSLEADDTPVVSEFFLRLDLYQNAIDKLVICTSNFDIGRITSLDWQQNGRVK